MARETGSALCRRAPTDLVLRLGRCFAAHLWQPVRSLNNLGLHHKHAPGRTLKPRARKWRVFARVRLWHGQPTVASRSDNLLQCLAQERPCGVDVRPVTWPSRRRRWPYSRRLAPRQASRDFQSNPTATYHLARRSDPLVSDTPRPGESAGDVCLGPDGRLSVWGSDKWATYVNRSRSRPRYSQFGRRPKSSGLGIVGRLTGLAGDVTRSAVEVRFSSGSVHDYATILTIPRVPGSAVALVTRRAAFDVAPAYLKTSFHPTEPLRGFVEHRRAATHRSTIIPLAPAFHDSAVSHGA